MDNIKYKISRSIKNIKYVPKYSNKLNLNENELALNSNTVPLAFTLTYALNSMNISEIKKSQKVQRLLEQQLDKSIRDDVKFKLSCDAFSDENYIEKCKYYKENYENLKKYR